MRELICYGEHYSCENAWQPREGPDGVQPKLRGGVVQVGHRPRGVGLGVGINPTVTLGKQLLNIIENLV